MSGGQNVPELTPGCPQAVVGVSLKMYFGHAATLAWVQSLLQLLPLPAGVRLFVMPSFPALKQACEILRGTGIAVGAQDVWPDRSGPFTGEVSAANVAELGCEYAEVGHAERRRLFAESDWLVSRKIRASLEAGITPVLCLGEVEQGPRAVETVLNQARAGLAGVQDGAVVLAYEPVWAIGAERPAPAEYVRPIVGALRSTLHQLRPHSPLQVLYGGSADESVVDELISAGDPATRVDGLFLGRAAHDVARLADILERVSVASRPVRTTSEENSI
jgi:triosephosphate isomerase